MHTVILCGLETIYNQDGTFKLFSCTFRNNADTYAAEHETEIVDVIDARDYKSSPTPMGAVMGKLRSLSRVSPIDLFVYNGHSSTNNLLVFYKWAATSDNDQRFITHKTSWSGVNFAHDATIELWSCRTGGNYVRDESCIAQAVADNSRVPTWGYICRTSQKQVGNKYYQMPEKDEYRLEVFDPHKEM
jgi:hypothetical protein